MEVKLYQAKDGWKEFEGELKKYEKDEVTILPDGSEETIVVTGKEIAMIRLAFE